VAKRARAVRIGSGPPQWTQLGMRPPSELKQGGQSHDVVRELCVNVVPPWPQLGTGATNTYDAPNTSSCIVMIGIGVVSAST
jgi:hypothetical protein